MGCCFSKKTDSILKCTELTNSQLNKLKSLTLKDVGQFSFENMTVFAKPVSVYDGDTLRSAFYYKDEIVQTSCRAIGYDSPEMKISLQDPHRVQLKILAIKARDRFRELIYSSDNGLIKLKISKNDLYGRSLVDIYIQKGDEDIYVNEIMIEEGLGKRYDGGTKIVWTIEDYERIMCGKL